MQDYGNWEPGPGWQAIAGAILLIVVFGGALLLWDDDEPANLNNPDDYREQPYHPLDF